MLSSKNAVARLLNAEPLSQNHKVLKELTTGKYTDLSF